MAYKTILRVSVPNLKSLETLKTEFKEVGEFSIMLYEKIGWWAFFCPPTWLLQYETYGDFLTLNIYNSYIYWCINLKLAEILKIGLFTLSKYFVEKVVNLNF